MNFLGLGGKEKTGMQVGAPVAPTENTVDRVAPDQQVVTGYVKEISNLVGTGDMAALEALKTKIVNDPDVSDSDKQSLVLGGIKRDGTPYDGRITKEIQSIKEKQAAPPVQEAAVSGSMPPEIGKNPEMRTITPPIIGSSIPAPSSTQMPGTDISINPDFITKKPISNPPPNQSFRMGGGNNISGMQEVETQFMVPTNVLLSNENNEKQMNSIPPIPLKGTISKFTIPTQTPSQMQENTYRPESSEMMNMDTMRFLFVNSLYEGLNTSLNDVQELMNLDPTSDENKEKISAGIKMIDELVKGIFSASPDNDTDKSHVATMNRAMEMTQQLREKFDPKENVELRKKIDELKNLEDSVMFFDSVRSILNEISVEAAKKLGERKITIQHLFDHLSNVSKVLEDKLVVFADPSAQTTIGELKQQVRTVQDQLNDRNDNKIILPTPLGGVNS